MKRRGARRGEREGDSWSEGVWPLEWTLAHALRPLASGHTRTPSASLPRGMRQGRRAAITPLLDRAEERCTGLAPRPPQRARERRCTRAAPGGGEGGREAGREAGRQGGREAGRQGGREAGRQGGREAEGGRGHPRSRILRVCLSCSLQLQRASAKFLPCPGCVKYQGYGTAYHCSCGVKTVFMCSKI
jgi:hypothetical protein